LRAPPFPLSIGIALAMALWVSQRIAGRAFLRMAYFTPTVLPMIAVANIWLFFYTPQYGLLEQVTGALGLPSHNWLGDPRTALACADDRRDLEGGGLLHDLLPRSPADAQPEPAARPPPSRGHRDGTTSGGCNGHC
jgi:hypothetical protein